jgi:nucleotide-binding universal stress UspA family protein
LQELAQAAAAAGVTASKVIEQRTPAETILRLSRRFEASLIILVPQQRNRWSRLFRGPSTTERVTREAECHVMLVRPIGTASGVLTLF